MNDGYVYFNVNEEGEAYEYHPDLDSAMRTLERYPEDSVVIARHDSFIARKLSSQGE